jgi:hypothetical protein
MAFLQISSIQYMYLFSLMPAWANHGTYNIFLVYHYLSTYRRYFLQINFENIFYHEYHKKHSLKLGRTKYHFKWLIVPDSTPL